MSLQPRTAFQIPEETQRVARAAFPRSTLCLQIADALGPVYEDESFADLFPRRGQPAQAPGRLAWVTVLQFVENLSDRAAADAVRGRLDWKYLQSPLHRDLRPGDAAPDGERRDPAGDDPR